MRYRMEMLDDGLVVRNVETDLVVGRVQPYTKANSENPDLPLIDACAVFNSGGHDVDYITVRDRRDPLRHALCVAAFDEADRGYPNLKHVEKRPDPCRVEIHLGGVVADTVAALACAVTEHRNAGLSAGTKEKIGRSFARLLGIWYASRFGSFNGETFANDPYFRNTDPQGPRLTFDEAVQHWGLDELRYDFPGAPEATLNELLALLLEFFSGMLNHAVGGRWRKDAR